MFVTLLGVTFLISLLVCFIVVRIFQKPIDLILHRIISEEISIAWSKYLRFAIFVVGISSGVNLWKLEKYITPQTQESVEVLQLNFNRWLLEVYRTVIETLQGIAWMLLIFFIFALIAYVIVRIFDIKKNSAEV